MDQQSSRKWLVMVQAWTGEESLGDALVGTLQRLPKASWVFTTLGARGAVLVQRVPEQEASG